MTLVTQRPGAADRPEVQVLIKEARQHQRRRWLAAGAVVIVLGGIIVGVVATMGSHGGARISAPRVDPAGSAARGPSSSRSGAVELAWIASGGLHLGDPSNGTDHLVPHTSAAAGPRLVHIGSRVFFFETSGYDPSALNGGRHIAAFDTSTGQVRQLSEGINLTTTADGRNLFVALDPTHLVELSPTGARLSPVWTIPSGYTLESYAAQQALAAVAGGIVVQSALPVSPNSGAHALAIWDPAAGSIRRVAGQEVFVIGSYTEPGRDHGLVAWIDATGTGIDSWRLAITDTATLSTRLISSPLRGSFPAVDYGDNFIGGGGFSPDGRQLAAFVTAYRPHDWPDAQLVLVNSSTGSVRLVGNTVVQIGEPQGWVAWAPDGTEVFGGSFREGAVIQAFKLKVGQTRATPLSLDRNADDDVTGSAVAMQGNPR